MAIEKSLDQAPKGLAEDVEDLLGEPDLACRGIDDKKGRQEGTKAEKETQGGDQPLLFRVIQT